MSRLKLLTAAVAVSAALTLNACSPGASSTASPTSVTAAVYLDAAGWDPYQADSGPSLTPLQTVYDTLLRLNTDGTYTGLLAETFGYTDPTTYELTIRDGVTFSDGTALDAAAVVTNLNRLPEATGAGVASITSFQSATKVDDRTVRITLNAPDPGFQDELARNAGMMVSPAALTSGNVAQVPVGAGAYVMDAARTVAGDSWTMTKRTDYWNEVDYPFASITFKVYSDATAILNAVRSGTVQISPGDSTTLSAAKTAGLNVYTPQAPSIWGIVLSDRGGQNLKALGDVRVRQALNLAIDRKAVADAVAPGVSAPAQQWFAPATVGYDSALDGTYDYNPDRARKLLSEAGYPDGFELAVTIAPIHPAMATALQGQLADIGVKLRIDDVGSNFFPDVQAAKNPAYTFTYGEFPFYSALAGILAPDGTFNPYHTNDSTVNGLLSEISSSSDSDTRTKLYKELGAYITEQAWFLPVFSATTIYYSSSSIELATDQVSGAAPFWGWAPAKK